MSAGIADAPAPVASNQCPMVTPREVSEAMGVSRGTVIAWARAGRIKAVKVGRTVRVPRDVLDDLLACRQTA